LEIDREREAWDGPALVAVDEHHLRAVRVVTELDRGKALLDLELRLDVGDAIRLDVDRLLERFVTLAAVDLELVVARRHVADLWRRWAGPFVADDKLEAASFSRALPARALARAGELDVLTGFFASGHAHADVGRGRVARCADLQQMRTGLQIRNATGRAAAA